MTITDIRVKPVESDNPRLKAIVSITIEEEFVIHDIKLIQNEDEEYFVSMPSKKDKQGERKDIAHPIKTATRLQIRDMAIAKYKELVNI